MAKHAATEDAEDSMEQDNPVPDLKPGVMLSILSGRLLTKKTKPATRFTEASLVRELERRGIGRPSTYAAILETIMRRGYIRIEKRFLLPTTLGETVVDSLCGHFRFVEYEFTRIMEQALDNIAEGKADYIAVLCEAHAHLEHELQAFSKATGKKCPKCAKPMVHRVKKPGKDGKGGYDFGGAPAGRSAMGKRIRPQRESRP